MSCSEADDRMQLRYLVDETRAMAEKSADPAEKKALITVAEAYLAMLQRAEKEDAAGVAAG